MVGIEHVLGIGQVVLDLGLLAPGQARKHVNVVAHHGGFGRHGRHELELLELGLGLLARLGGHAGQLDLLLDLFDVGAVFALAQFLLDGLDLLVQVEVALVLLHLALDAAADALVDVEDVDFAVQLLEEVFQALLDVHQVEHGLLVLKLERQVRGNGVGQAAGIVDAGDGGEDLGRDLLVELDVLVELLRHGAAQGFDLAGLVGFGLGRHGHDGAHEVGLFIHDLLDQRALLAFDQHLDRAVGQLEHLQDGGHAADVEHVGRRGFVLGGGLLGHQHDAAVALHGQLQRLDALGATHEQRDHHVGEHDHIAQRQQRQV